MNEHEPLNSSGGPKIPVAVMVPIDVRPAQICTRGITALGSYLGSSQPVALTRLVNPVYLESGAPPAFSYLFLTPSYKITYRMNSRRRGIRDRLLGEGFGQRGIRDRDSGQTAMSPLHRARAFGFWMNHVGSILHKLHKFSTVASPHHPRM